MSSRKELFLLGRKLTHSFSKQFFEDQFKDNPFYNNWTYNLYEMGEIDQFNRLKLNPGFLGCNVTIPYKTAIIDFLDKVDFQAKKIGAVNTVVNERIGDVQILKGYNTDATAFQQTLLSFKDRVKVAMVLGNGGASKAVQFVLQEMGIQYKVVGRSLAHNFKNFQADWLLKADLIVNCTPLGMHPDIETAPDIPYKLLTKSHILYDLVYNPKETLFLKKGKTYGCTVKNGLEMLHLQAEMALKLFVKAASN